MNAQAQTQNAAKSPTTTPNGARSSKARVPIFLAQGFDAASMSDIARAAGVSKGTLYVYFENKEQLFEAIVHEECLDHAEGIFDLDPDDHDVEGILTRLGTAYVDSCAGPEKASALRTVIAIADRMPEIGKIFYETGPAVGIAKLAAYLRAQTEAGVLAVDDCEVAAAQFLDACQVDAVQAGAVQFPRSARAGADRHVCRHRGADLPRCLPRDARPVGLSSLFP